MIRYSHFKSLSMDTDVMIDIETSCACDGFTVA